MRHPWQAVSRRGRQGVQAVALGVEALAANAHRFGFRVSLTLARLGVIDGLLTVY